MTISNTEIDKMQRELAILMTNSVELQNKMYDIFVNKEPCEVELRVWTDAGFETIKVKNLAASRIPVESGEGSPFGVVGTTKGTIYVDTASEQIYINTGRNADDEGISTTGWVKLITQDDIDEHNASDSAHLGVLALIHGDSSNHFRVADTDVTSDAHYAVNVGSLNVILGHPENLDTTSKSIVEAINEVDLLAEKECAVVVDSNLNRVRDTQKPKIFHVVATNDSAGSFSLVIDSGLTTLTAIKANGEKYTCESAYEIPTRKNLTGERILVFLKDLDEVIPTFECVINGNYFIGETRPYIMKEGDVWLDTGCRPYKMYQEVLVEGLLVEQEVDYIYLGTVEEM